MSRSLFGMVGAIVVVFAAACGDDQALPTIDSGGEPDAPAGPCWREDGHVPRGSATIGTGRDAFEPMPDPLRIEYGSQDGFDLIANVRMSGLVPGNPDDILDPDNPRTRILAYFADTNVPLNFYARCPFRAAYVPSGTGDYVMLGGVGIIFETCWRAQHLIGKQVRIDLELLDRDSGYTKSSVTVTLAPPLEPYPMETDPLPGCVH